MKKPFTYTFTKEVSGINKDKLLDDFKQNFIETNCNHEIIQKVDKLELKNNIFDFNYRFKMISPWNLWLDIGQMQVRINKNNSDNTHIIQFNVSILKPILLSIIFMTIAFIMSINYFSFSLIIFFLLFFSLRIIIWYFRHKRFFLRTINIGNFRKYQTIKTYDWDRILKQKSDSELNDIINEKTSLPDIVIELARKEKETRKMKI